MENNQNVQESVANYEAPMLIELSEEDLPGLEFTNGSTQSMTATMTNCG
nr:hypothetical protein [uncultured Acetatifactor sp.]